MRDVLLEHFDIKFGSGQNYRDLSVDNDPFTQKMELVFIKDATSGSSTRSAVSV